MKTASIVAAIFSAWGGPRYDPSPSYRTAAHRRRTPSPAQTMPLRNAHRRYERVWERIVRIQGEEDAAPGTDCWFLPPVAGPLVLKLPFTPQSPDSHGRRWPWFGRLGFGGSGQ